MQHSLSVKFQKTFGFWLGGSIQDLRLFPGFHQLSLVEKQRNLERALEDYNYKLSQINDSIGKLIAERNKALLRKQEEFKREVLLNSQKVFNEDSSSVFAVTANIQDA